MKRVELDEIGSTYLEALLAQIKLLEIYEDGDEELLLRDIAIAHQLYEKELLLSLDEGEKTVHHMKSQRFIKMRNDGLKQAGIGILQRVKVKAKKPDKPEETIFDAINDLMES